MTPKSRIPKMSTSAAPTRVVTSVIATLIATLISSVMGVMASVDPQSDAPRLSKRQVVIHTTSKGDCRRRYQEKRLTKLGDKRGHSSRKGIEDVGHGAAAATGDIDVGGGGGADLGKVAGLSGEGGGGGDGGEGQSGEDGDAAEGEHLAWYY